MATKFKFEIESGGLTVEQASAFSIFVKSLNIAVSVTNDVQAGLIKLAEIETTQSEEVEIPEPAKKKRASRAKVEEVQAEEVQAEEVQAEEPQTEEPQAEEPQAEEPQTEEQDKEDQPKPNKTPAFSIQDVSDRVKVKAKPGSKWRTSIKAELERLGSSSVTLLDPKHFEEFCDFMDNLA